ncbi:twin-arginine translocation signal domain-containing protein [Campylobacter californiensis]|uniref:twin-arginine translocation signal domain-containing protein n=1 Tax=Campylobacter californiensis TaxID=1032243 RepID=UPI001D142C45|nr:twin-arginine translocation signal domain-containing protein [Campylobacter sp. RM12916]
MKFKETNASRRSFLKGAMAIAAAATLEVMLAGYTPFKSDSLQVWSCGDYLNFLHR